MTARVLPRGYGVVITCNGYGCGATTQTANVSITNNRDWARAQGWGRGMDKGTPHRAAVPAKPSVRSDDGKLVRRAKPALAEIPGRPRTLSHDLCPLCMPREREAADLRRRLTAERRKKRDAARKAAA